MNARQILAEAHQRMTPEQIAAHALDLAHIIEGYAAAQAGLVTYAGAVGGSLDTHQRALRQFQTAIRTAVSAHASGKTRAVGKFLTAAAEIQLPPIVRVADLSAYRPLDMSIFNPTE